MIFLVVFSSFFIFVVRSLEYDVVTDYSVNDCLITEKNDQLKKYFYLDQNNFPHCDSYDETVTCGDGDKKPCAPGLKCGDSKKCVVDTSSCFKYYANVTGNTNIQQLLWRPDCLEDGSWAPKQCKGGSAGRCFCYDKRGKRIFGNAFKENSANMTCACSRRKAELLNGTRTYVSFHCDSQGNFEELQCDSGHCWCAEPQTGEPKSMIVPENAMKYLDCSKNLQGSQYLRKCESQARAQTKIMDIMRRHNTTSPNVQIVACGDDGSYGPYTILNPSIYCVKRNNEKMAYHEDQIANLADLNCNCAHDSDLYNSLGKPFTLKCNNDGNYKPLQSIIESNKMKRFCVDTDGNKMVDNVTKDTTDEDCQKFYD